MREVLDRHPQVVEHAREAMRRAGIEPIERPIRGGTDGSRLSFMGLPTPNLFAGEHNFHSRLEWVSVQDMEKAVEVIVNLARVWAEERARSTPQVPAQVSNPKASPNFELPGHAELAQRLRTLSPEVRRARLGSWNLELGSLELTAA